MNIKAAAESFDKSESYILESLNFFDEIIKDTIDNITKNVDKIIYKYKKSDKEEFKKYIENEIKIDTEKLYKYLIKGILISYLFGYFNSIGQTKRKIRKIKKYEEPYYGDKEIFKIMLLANKRLLMRLSLIKNLTVDEAIDTYFKPSKSALEFLNNYTVDLAGIQSRNFKEKVTNLVSKTIEKGLSDKQSYDYIKKQLGVLSGDLKKFTKNRMRMVAKTEATRSFNVGTLNESYKSDIVVGYQFDAVLDKNTTNICRSRWGKFIKKDDTKALARNTPPLHINCRSVLRVVTKYEKSGMPLNKENLNKNLEPYLWDSKKIPQAIQRQKDIDILEKLLNKWKNE
jgi:SPP1 gp7 family putative phage head morphogenesis protein